MLNPNKEDPEQKFILETSQRNINRLAKLINDILDFQKIEFGAMEYHFEKHQVNDLIRQVVDELMPSIKAKKLTISLSLSDQIPEILFDWDRMEDVLFNLISNAIKYTDNGQILIVSAYSTQDKELKLSVIDTGIGLSKENIPRVFDKFQQLSKEYNRSKGGSGLGLAIVKKIVEAHQARIEVKSEVGAGSTFTIYIKNKQ
jgi:signal transduction histidine kinase